VKQNTVELPYDVENTLKLPYDVGVPYDVKQKTVKLPYDVAVPHTQSSTEQQQGTKQH